MDFWSRLDEIKRRWNVLEHPFYQRWSVGELTRPELALYAGQYRHAVVALADAADGAARAASPAISSELVAHAAQERAHIELWDGFAGAVGAPARVEPAAETAACARAWAGDGSRPLLSSLVALYAIESAQPAISETKRAGLRDFYDFDEGPATAYFDVHAQLDHEHAAAERELIEQRIDDADADALLAEAEAVASANWRLLDGVERLLGREPAAAASC